MSKAFRFPVLIATIAATLGVCASAEAQITVGEVAPPNPSAYCANGPFDGIPFGSAASTYTIPANGVITSWSTSATSGAGQELMLKVFHPTGEGPEKYVVAGHDGPHPLTPSTVNTFKSSLVVKAGDVIGENSVNPGVAKNACVFATTKPADELLVGFSGPDGSPFTTVFLETSLRANVSATLLPAPTIASLSPASGSIKGGTSVAITGSNFAEVKGVSFGATPARSFAINSESQITAVAPASARLADVPVTVTTIVGTTTSPITFVYEGCVVPKLRGKKLKGAKKRLRRADCRIGKVKKLGKATAKTGRVKKQNPKPGKLLAPGSKVNVKLG